MLNQNSFMAKIFAQMGIEKIIMLHNLTIMASKKENYIRLI